MEVRFTLSAVRHVPVYLWPWVWWQLLGIRNWCGLQQREVLWEVDPDGKVWVTYMSDDPRDLVAWFKCENKLYRAHWYALYNESGEMHLSGIHYWAGRLMTRCVQVSAPLVCDAEAGVPAFQDSS
ncbi:MAG: hypothetical protein AAF768_08860 [Pseudomonadota bacterium]